MRPALAHGSAAIALAVLAASAAACSTSVRAKAKTSTESGTDLYFDPNAPTPWEGTPGTGSARPRQPAPPVATMPGSTVFYGVTHDLTLAEAAPKSPACSCLAVALGAPSDPAFAWRVGVPEIGPDAMVVAIAGKGVACDFRDRRGETPVPSIAGVERAGDDVVIVVEAWRPGIPLAQGAVVQRPGPNGAIVVHARGRVPFATPADGSRNACRLAAKG